MSFSLVLPLKTPDLTLRGFLVNHTWNLPRRLNALSSAVACSSSISACGAGESRANYPGYWLLQRTDCDLHEVTFSSNVQTFATFFWKTINSPAFSSASLPYPLSLARLPLPHSLPLAIVFTQTEKIYCQKSEGCARRWNCWCVFSAASDYLLVNWLLFFAVEVWSEADMEKVLTLLLQDCSCWYSLNCVTFVQEKHRAYTDPPRFLPLTWGKKIKKHTITHLE